MVHVYTGDGKGKTTAALGLAVRAAGHGLKVLIVQFMKGRVDYGEVRFARKPVGIRICQFGRPDFVDKAHPSGVDVKLAQQGLEFAREAVLGGSFDLVVLDEINVALDYRLVCIDDVLAVIRAKPAHVELVLTGRGAPPALLAVADYGSEVRELKHPFRKGILARKGIDF